MVSSKPQDQMHRALDFVARMCIDENLLDEAERMLAFLETAGISEYTTGLLRVWASSQRGELRDALRQCSAMHESYPDSSDIVALLAVLRYSCGEPQWRPLCERLMDWPTCRAESRQVAASLLDGSFGRQPTGAPAAAPAAAVETAPSAESDYAFATHYLRG